MNGAVPSLLGGSLEITLTIPLQFEVEEKSNNVDSANYRFVKFTSLWKMGGDGLSLHWNKTEN